jgi:hypothetical protein
VHLAVVGDEVAFFAGVGEEGDRGSGTDQNEVIDSGELGAGQFGEVGESLDVGQSRASALSGW